VKGAKKADPNAPPVMLARSYVNDAVARIKGMYKWAVSEELVPPSAYHALETVRGLKRGQTSARETPKKAPVPLKYVAAILRHVRPVVRAMLRVQTLTGVRSESICYAVPEQFDRSGEIWLWRPKHKTENLGKELIIPIGPRCQRVLRKWLDEAKPGAFIFSPRTISANRKYNRHYETQSYCTAVVRGIRKANRSRKPDDQIPHWTPHQIRHLKGTTVNDAYGIEAAQAILGHDSMNATKIYSGRRLSLAKQIAKETG
jgi:integrase